jgi:hypothetical protein
MLEPNSVDQILRVLELLRQNKRLGFDTATACSRAIQQVAKEASVRYQTIGDGCRRRLGLVDMSEFHRLSEEWLNGNPLPLVTVLKKSSTPGSASRIKEFFGEAQGLPNLDSTSIMAPGTRVPRETVSKPVRIIVENGDARMLLVLAQLEGVEPTAIAVDLLRTGMKDRLRAALA